MLAFSSLQTMPKRTGGGLRLVRLSGLGRSCGPSFTNARAVKFTTRTDPNPSCVNSRTEIFLMLSLELLKKSETQANGERQARDRQYSKSQLRGFTWAAASAFRRKPGPQ